MNVASHQVSSVVINDIRVELIERGAGKPVLFLHPGIGISPSAPVLDALAHGARLLAPAHPGFGTSELPKGMNATGIAADATTGRLWVNNSYPPPSS